MVGRSTGRSALAAAAYRSGTRLGEHDFTGKAGVAHGEILLPEGAPAWMADRERLWRAASDAERRVDSQEAREITVALPRELGREERVELAREFAREAFVSLGMVADLSVHEPKARDGGDQPHAHVLLTTRRVEDADGFCATKERAWNDRALLLAWRELWAERVNEALERAGREERVDHRSLATRCVEAVRERDFDRAALLDREPEPKVGWKAWAWERRGVLTEKGEEWRATLARNVERSAVYEMVAEAGEKARERFLELRERAGDVREAVERWAEEYGERTRGVARVGYAIGVALGAGVVGAVMYEQRFERLAEEVVSEMWGSAMAAEEKAVTREREREEPLEGRGDGPDPAWEAAEGSGPHPGDWERQEPEERDLSAGYEADEMDALAAAALEERGEVEATRDRERMAEERERDDGDERER